MSSLTGWLGWAAGPTT